MDMQPHSYLAGALALVLTVSARAETIVQLEFPYANSFSNAKYEKGLGNGAADFDGDEDSSDMSRGAVFSTPDSAEYLSEENATVKGLTLDSRIGVAHLNSTAEAPRQGVLGFTKDDLRLWPVSKEHSVSDNMAYATWVLFTQPSFGNGGEAISLTDSTNFSMELGNVGASEIRFLVRAGDDFYVSQETTESTSFSLSDAAKAKWLPYPQAMSGRNLRYQGDKSEAVAGKELADINGVGFYAEKIGFDGNQFNDVDLDLRVTEFTVNQ